MSKCKITGKVLSVRLGREETQLLLLGGNSEILYSAAVPTPAGAVEDGMIRNQDAVRDMLKTALLAPEFKRVKQAVFVLCTTQVITEQISTPDLPPAKLEKLLQSNIDMYFPVDTKDYQLVWEVLGPKGDGSTKEVDIQLWAVPISMITRYYTVANACGLSVLAVDYCGHAIATAVGASFSKPAKKATKQKKKLDLNAEISFGKKKKESPAAEMEAAEEMPQSSGSETELHLLLENDLLGMTFVQNSQVVLQRFIRCGSDPSYQFGEMAMMLEYFRGMDTGRGSTIRGIVAGELTKDKYILEDLEDVLGIPLTFLKTGYEPPWCLCYGAAHTTIDFGAPSLNAPGLSRKHMQSQLGQYVAILACGLVLVAVVLFTMSAKLGWDMELGILRANQQTLMMTSAKYSGFADNYYEYQKMYSDYSQDWDLIFYNLQTYNDNMVRVLEELEELVPEKTSVTSMQMVSNALNVTFACSNKEEAAYLIMALREMQYADLIAVSSLSGGGRGAAESYGDPNYQRGEKPPTEGGASIEDVTVTIAPETVPATEAPAVDPTETTVDPNAESDEFIMNMIGFIGGMLTSGTEQSQPETPAETSVPETTVLPTETTVTPTEATVPETTVPTESTSGPSIELPPGIDENESIMGIPVTQILEYVQQYLETGETIAFAQNIIEQQINKYVRTGHTDYPTLDTLIVQYAQNGSFDKRVDDWLGRYVTCNSYPAFVSYTIENFIDDGTTDVPELDQFIKQYILARKADKHIKTVYEQYVNDGEALQPKVQVLIEKTLADPNKSTGILELDDRINYIVNNYTPETPTEPTTPSNPSTSQPIINKDNFDELLMQFMTEGTTGIPALDNLINFYLNPPQTDSGSDSGKPSSSGGTQVTDTRVFFSAVLGYNSELRNAELNRKGLDYTDKLLPMEVNE